MHSDEYAQTQFAYYYDTILQNYPLWCCCHVMYKDKLLYPSIIGSVSVRVRVMVRVSVIFTVYNVIAHTLHVSRGLFLISHVTHDSRRRRQ